MKKWTILWLSGLMGLAVGPHALSAESESTTAAAPYLLAGAPSFDARNSMPITQSCL